MRSIAARWALAGTLALAGPASSQALELQGKILCAWSQQSQECTGPRCHNVRNTGEQAFWVDFDNRTLCTNRDPLRCTEWLRLDVVHREPEKKTVLLIAYRPDGALMYRVSESSRVFGVIMVGMDRVMVADGLCERR
ncbi:MAG TPA: hypothetical protein VJ890_11640 [Vineibacter sp.]|nr:hypothetical protein [Vineibacter sp.]